MAALPERLRYLVIEGPIGVGKTSLARLFAARCGVSLLLEAPDANPFLPGFYRNPARHALPTQLFFLFQRLEQVGSLAQGDMFRRATVADFLFDKDPLFAELTLTEAELRLYRQIYDHVRPQAPVPDLVIYLQAPAEVLAGRVRRRAVAYEQGMDDGYLVRLADRYARFFHDYDAAPVLIVNSEHLNFVDQPAAFDLLLERIGAMRGAREFFSLGE
jgi:deoxyadenosine/deoxycytidine kinase